jgi:hypothetical protein
MRKLKKFKRYEEGGAVGSGSGDPFSYTDFSDRARNLRKPSEAAEIDRSRDVETASVKPPKVTESKIPEPVKTEKETKAEEKESVKDRGETDFTENYAPQRPYNQALEDAKEQGRRARDAFKPAKPAADKPINISTGASGFKFPKEDTSYKNLENARADRTKPSAPARAPKSAGPEDIPGTDVKNPYKGETIDNSNLPAKQFAQSMLGATAVGRVVSPAIRGAAMVGRMLESPRAEGKGTGKIPEEKPEINVPRTPAVVRAKPKEPAPAKEQTPAEKMGLRETEPMRRAREAKEQFEAAGKSAKEAADKSSKNAADEVAAEAAKRAASKRQTPDNRRFPNKGSATPGRPKARAEFKPTGNKFDRPVGEKRGPKTDEVLEREGLPIKKGGKIPAFKKGGFVSRGDGCAQRGKTKGRMM